MMFGRKKQEPQAQPPDPFAALQPGPLQSAFNRNALLLGFSTNISSNTAMQMMGVEGKSSPEPKDEPKTVVGLTGYRLYTLDNELYLRGAQGKRQKGRESGQAKHNGDVLTFDPPQSHPAPAWDCLCGFAAFFWPTSLGAPGWDGVLAEVQAGGRTIYCEQGWRAERIVLNKIWVACPIFPDAALGTLRKRYEVPVEVL